VTNTTFPAPGTQQLMADLVRVDATMDDTIAGIRKAHDAALAAIDTDDDLLPDAKARRRREAKATARDHVERARNTWRQQLVDTNAALERAAFGEVGSGPDAARRSAAQQRAQDVASDDIPAALARAGRINDEALAGALARRIFDDMRSMSADPRSADTVTAGHRDVLASYAAAFPHTNAALDALAQLDRHQRETQTNPFAADRLRWSLP